MDELSSGISGEGVVHEVLSECVSAIDGGAGGAGEVSADASAAFDHAFDYSCDAPAGADDAPWFVGADAEDLCGTAVCGDAVSRGLHAFGEESIVGDPVLEVVGVGAGELSTEVVEGHPVLSAAAFESEFVGEGVEPEIAAGDFFGGLLGAFWRGDNSAVAAAGEEMDSVILSPLEAVEHALDVEEFETGAEAREDNRAMLGMAVLVAVFKPPDIGGCGDVEPVVGPDEAGWPREVVREDL